MKKTVLILFFGSVLAGVILLLGVTWVFGAIAESGVENFSETAPEPDEDAWLIWDFDFADYQRGFFSSETTSQMQLAAKTDSTGELESTDGVPLRHRVFHGPLAMTPEGPKLCSYHVVTTVRREDVPPKMQASLEKDFGGADPIALHTTIGFGGTQITRIEVAPFSIDDKASGSMRFDGAFANLKTGRDLAFARGKFEIGAISRTDSASPPFQFEIDPVTGSLDFVKGEYLHAHFDGGGAKSTAGDGVFTMAASSGDIDWEKSAHLNAQFTLGSIEGAETTGQERATLGPGTASVAFKPVSESFDLFLGEAKLHLEKFEGSANGEDFSVNDLSVRFDSGEKEGKLYALVEYEIGTISSSQFENSPMPSDAIFGKGAKLEFGVQGFDLASIESLIGKGTELPGLESVKALSDYSQPEVVEAWSAALAENSEMLNAYGHTLFNMIQPGLEIYYTATLRGAEGDSGFDLRLGMGGEKKLTELNTPREILSAVQGDVLARVSKRQFPPEMFKSLVAESPIAPFVSEHPNHYEAKGELQGGKLYVKGEPIPLLDSLGPEMDEVIDWNAMFQETGTGK